MLCYICSVMCGCVLQGGRRRTSLMLLLNLTPMFDVQTNHNQNTPNGGSPLLLPTDSCSAMSRVCSCPGAEMPPPVSALMYLCLLPGSWIQPRRSVSPGTAVLAPGVCVLLQGRCAGRSAGLEAAVKTSSQHLCSFRGPLPRGQMCQMCHCGPDTAADQFSPHYPCTVPWDTAPAALPAQL